MTRSRSSRTRDHGANALLGGQDEGQAVGDQRRAWKASITSSSVEKAKGAVRAVGGLRDDHGPRRVAR